MKNYYYKDGESVIDSILSEWGNEVNESNDSDFKSSFQELIKAKEKFEKNLNRLGYVGYFN